jgi:hypothetical protein
LYELASEDGRGDQTEAKKLLTFLAENSFGSFKAFAAQKLAKPSIAENTFF